MSIVKKRRPAVVRVKEPWEVEELNRKSNQDNQLDSVESSKEQYQEMNIDSKEENEKETYEKNMQEENKLLGFRPSKVNEKDKVKRSTSGVISVVNAKTGKRVILARTLLDTLNNPEKVLISFSNNKLAIGQKLSANDNYFTVKDYKGKGVIYSADLVKELSENFKLDFFNRTTITFTEVEYIEYEDTTVAIITIKNEEGNI